jgi:hypothetical protein
MHHGWLQHTTRASLKLQDLDRRVKPGRARDVRIDSTGAQLPRHGVSGQSGFGILQAADPSCAGGSELAPAGRQSTSSARLHGRLHEFGG